MAIRPGGVGAPGPGGTLAGSQVLHAGDGLLPHGNTLITIVGNGENGRESPDSATHISEIKVPAGIVRAAGVAH